jgi:bifunctional UDP-N-acetylglucosamine pyrophosphorylase/glucosamine-1-phosphate N-acetyltransferase
MSALGIVLAAGKSTRMKSTLPKVLHDVCGRPMIEHVLDALRRAGVEKTVVVVGHRADLVQGALSKRRDLEFALQEEQKGTGHAVMMCREQLAQHDGPVLVLAGDTPLLKSETLKLMLEAMQGEAASCVIGTAMTTANQGLGRIVRSPSGSFERIVEEKDATTEQKAIQEINTGCYTFDAAKLLVSLEHLKTDNAQGEYYLTDGPRHLLAGGEKVVAAPVFDIIEAMGVNTRVQLAEVSRQLVQETLQRLMVSGVTIVSPENTWIEPQVEIGRDTVIHPFCCLTGHTRIGEACDIGPYAQIANQEIPDASVIRAG